MKTIFITGASSGIGAATARLFAGNGWTVIATMRNLEKGKDLANTKGINIMPLDVTDSVQIKQTINEAIKQFDIDVLFNNAGYGMKGPLEKVEEEKVRKLFDTDLFGAMQVTQQFIPYFKKKESGMILTTTSLAGVIAFPLDAIYGAAKRALTSMCESLYYEMKPYGVKVKILIPGATRTNLLLYF